VRDKWGEALAGHSLCPDEGTHRLNLLRVEVCHPGNADGSALGLEQDAGLEAAPIEAAQYRAVNYSLGVPLVKPGQAKCNWEVVHERIAPPGALGAEQLIVNYLQVLPYDTLQLAAPRARLAQTLCRDSHKFLSKHTDISKLRS
jgi:hypothetical protein